MNRRFFFVLFLAIFFVESLYSQAPFRCGQLSASTSPINFLSHSDTIVPHTQKTIICDFDTNIAKGIYDVKIKHLESDNFALTFSMYSGRLHSVIVNRVKFNENYNDAKFVNLFPININKHDTERIETSYLKNVSSGSFIIPEYTPGYYVGNCENLNLENIYK